MRDTNQRATRPTLLLVDDTPANLELIVESLELEGYEILVALDGEEALRRAEWVLPDLILLDVMMPGVDGFEVCHRLKANPATAEIPVIFMTALNATQHKVEGFAAGAVDYLTKPLQIDEVRARVNAHLRLRALHRTLEENNTALQREIAERRRFEAQLRDAHERLRKLSNLREAEHEAQRKRIAWQMHEELAQNLATIRFGLGNVQAANPRADAEVRTLSTLLDRTLQLIRGVVAQLRPPVLDFGIGPALEWLASDFTRRAGLYCEWSGVDGTLQLDEGHTMALFRVAEEALENVAHHTGTRWVKMTLERDGDRCRLTIRDDGQGAATGDSARHTLGLMDIQERLTAFGGEMKVLDSPAAGTTVTAWLPIGKPAAMPPPRASA